MACTKHAQLASLYTEMLHEVITTMNTCLWYMLCFSGRLDALPAPHRVMPNSSKHQRNGDHSGWSPSAEPQLLSPSPGTWNTVSSSLLLEVSQSVLFALSWHWAKSTVVEKRSRVWTWQCTNEFRLLAEHTGESVKACIPFTMTDNQNIWGQMLKTV